MTKRVKGIISFVVSVVAVMVMMTGCGKPDSELIVGSWKYEGNDAGDSYWDIGGRIGANEDDNTVLAFHSDGGIEVINDGYVTNELDSFSLVDGRLKWMLPLGTTHYVYYSIKGDKLDITDEDGVTAHFSRDKGKSDKFASGRNDDFDFSKGGKNMFGESMSNSIISGVVAVIAFLVTIVIIILLYAFVLPDEKRDVLNKPFRAIHDFLKIRNLMIESILRFVYVFSVVSSVVGGFLSLFENFWLGIFSILLGPIVCRLIFEALLLNIILVKNVIEINNHMKGVEGSTEFSSNFSAQAMRVLEGLGKRIQDVTTSTGEGKADNGSSDNAGEGSSGKVCPNCGKTIPEDSEFCIFCGSRING